MTNIEMNFVLLKEVRYKHFLGGVGTSVTCYDVIVSIVLVTGLGGELNISNFTSLLFTKCI